MKAWAFLLPVVASAARTNHAVIGQHVSSAEELVLENMAARQKHAALEYEAVLGNSTLLDISSVKEGVPYIIRNTYAGEWQNAELSFDEGGSHPMISVAKDNPVNWGFKKQPNGYYRIHLMLPDSKWNHAELSWDGSKDHPMASLEFDDPVDWELRPQSNGYFRIVNKYPDGYTNWELSWDGENYGHSAHPMASVEDNDPVDWEILPAYDVETKWVPKQTIIGTQTISTESSVESGNEWSKSSEFSASVTATIGAFGSEMSATASTSYSKSVSNTLTKGKTVGNSVMFVADENNGYLWQAVTTIKSKHYKHRYDSPVEVKSEEFAPTPSKGHEPRCAPGYCVPKSGCQKCYPGGEWKTSR